MQVSTQLFNTKRYILTMSQYGVLTWGILNE
jgi:hypothetical protein